MRATDTLTTMLSADWGFVLAAALCTAIAIGAATAYWKGHLSAAVGARHRLADWRLMIEQATHRRSRFARAQWVVVCGQPDQGQ